MLKPVMVALAAFVLGGICQRAFAEAEPVAQLYENGGGVEIFR